MNELLPEKEIAHLSEEGQYLCANCHGYESLFELQNDFSVAILGLSKFFREDAAVTAQTMQIGNKPCRIYGEPHAEYLLLQMTGEHELQSIDHEVTVTAQSGRNFLFAAIPVESWNDALSPWEAPCCVGKAKLWRQGCGHPVLSDRAGCANTETTVQSPGRHQNHFGRLFAGRAVCSVGLHPD